MDHLSFLISPLNFSLLISQYTSLLALLTYLSSNFSLPPVIAIYQSILNRLAALPSSPPLSQLQELIHQSLAHHIYYHLVILPSLPTASPLIPGAGSLPTTTLLASIRLFPHNTLLLHTLALITPRYPLSLLDSPVRKILLDTVLTPENATLSTWLFAIWYQIHCCGNNRHAVRAVFERAVAEQAVAVSKEVWIWYMTWCLGGPSAGGGKQAAETIAATKVWERAVVATDGGVKDVYMWGLRHLESGSGAVVGEGARRIWRVMDEAGLRVHVDAEAWMERAEELRRASGTRG